MCPALAIFQEFAARTPVCQGHKPQASFKQEALGMLKRETCRIDVLSLQAHAWLPTAGQDAATRILKRGMAPAFAARKRLHEAG
jgi:hypothetical protein